MYPPSNSLYNILVSFRHISAEKGNFIVLLGDVYKKEKS